MMKKGLECIWPDQIPLLKEGMKIRFANTKTVLEVLENTSEGICLAKPGDCDRMECPEYFVRRSKLEKLHIFLAP